MGSVCCTSARAGDLTEAGEGWSIERTGSFNVRTRHGALSPPPLSSHWERKAYFSEIPSGQNCISLHRTSSSCSRICRSIDNPAGKFLDHHRGDGLLAIFNSPSESFRCSSRSYDQGANPVAIPSEPVLRRSAAAAANSSEEGSGLSAASLSFGMASEEALEASDSVLASEHAQAFSTLGLLTSNASVQSRQMMDPPSISESSSYEKMPLGFNSYQQMMRQSLDMPSGLCNKQRSSGSWRKRGFSELMESCRPGSSRWSRLGIPSNVFTDADHEETSEFYIRSMAPMHQHESCASSSQVEAHECGLCAKAISQKSLWSASRVMGSSDMPVVGILDCGHVYHAECLDQATPLVQAHDPPCPKCENQRSSERKVQEEAHGKMKSMGPSVEHSTRWKLSRVGVSTEDWDELEPASRSYQRVSNQGEFSESFLKKGVLPSGTAHGAERMGSRSLLKKQFSFRGKLSREASSSSSGSKRPGYPARVSPENL